MPRRKQKIKYSRKIVCKHLEPKGNISNSLQSLCYCPARDLILGSRAYVCQVCNIYDPAKTNRRFSEIYEESKKIVTQQELEDMIATNTLPEDIKQVAMIQCVGARNEERPYLVASAAEKLLRMH